jgi:hypothetical protein
MFSAVTVTFRPIHLVYDRAVRYRFSSFFIQSIEKPGLVLSWNETTIADPFPGRDGLQS